jgi:hypothetical protein
MKSGAILAASLLGFEFRVSSLAMGVAIGSRSSSASLKAGRRPNSELETRNFLSWSVSNLPE